MPRSLGQNIDTGNPIRCSRSRRPRSRVGLAAALGIVAAGMGCLQPTSAVGQPYTDAKTMEAVSDLGGDPAFSPPTLSSSNPIYYTGIVLNNPGQMLSTAADANSIPFNLGGQWQTFVQTVNVNSDGDYGGVALYAGQNYGNIPDTGFDPTRSYSNSDWTANVARLDSYPLNTAPGSPYPSLPSSGYQLQAGDLVEVITGGGLFFGGKWNINEEHFPSNGPNGSPVHEFNIVYLGHPGLPTPTPITLGQFASYSTDPGNPGPLINSTNTALTSNPEHYQGSYVELQHVELVTPHDPNWVSGSGQGGFAGVLVTDGTHQFMLDLGINSGFTPATAPTGWFNAVGIFDQESPPAAGPYNGNYLMFVMSPSDISLLTPEPSTGLLALIALAGMVGWRARSRSRN